MLHAALLDLTASRLKRDACTRQDHHVVPLLGFVPQPNLRCHTYLYCFYPALSGKPT